MQSDTLQPTDTATPANVETPAGKQTIDQILTEFYANQNGGQQPVHIITGRNEETGVITIRFSRPIPALAFTLDQAREFVKAVKLEIIHTARSKRATNQAKIKAKKSKKK